jgi:HEPN domain-containing protein
MPPEDINREGALDWLRHARSDFFFASTRIEKGLLETNCYHSQQCVEKAIKAVCVYRDVRFTYNHDLKTLIKELYSEELDQPSFTMDLKKLNGFAVTGRYPGFDEPVTDLWGIA